MPHAIQYTVTYLCNYLCIYKEAQWSTARWHYSYFSTAVITTRYHLMLYRSALALLLLVSDHYHNASENDWLDDVRDCLRGYSRRGMLYIIPPTHHVVLNSEDRFPQGKVYGGRGIAGRSVLWKLATCESRVKVESQARAVTTEPSRASMI